MFFRQSLIILLSFALAVFLKSIYSNAIALILALLVIIYLAFSNRKKIENLNLFVLITIILILVKSTGEIASPLFFLFYFLSFAIAFVFDPKVVFLFTAGLIVLFFPSALKTDLTRNLIMLFSLFLLSPLAFFAGTDYREKQEAKKKVADMEKRAQEIENDIEDVLYDNKQILTTRSAAKLNEALEDIEEVEGK